MDLGGVVSAALLRADFLTLLPASADGSKSLPRSTDVSERFICGGGTPLAVCAGSVLDSDGVLGSEVGPRKNFVISPF